MSSYPSLGPNGVTQVTGEHEVRALVETLVGAYTRPYFVGNSVAVLLKISHEVLGTPNIKLTFKQKWLLGSALTRLATLHKAPTKPTTGAEIAEREATAKQRSKVINDFVSKVVK